MLRDKDGGLVYEVRFPDKFVFFSHATMKHHFQQELIAYY